MDWIGIKRNTITILIVLLSFSILFATLLTLPRIDKALPDPYFHVKITPAIYWIGFCLTIFVTLLIVPSKRGASGRYGLGFSPLCCYPFTSMIYPDFSM